MTSFIFSNLNVFHVHFIFFLVEIEQLKSKYNLLKNESHTTINKLQLEVIKLKLRLKNQSRFSSIVGSTFCYYLWKATQISSVVDMVLEEVIIFLYDIKYRCQ